MYTWVIVINKMGEQKIPTQTKKRKKKRKLKKKQKPARKTQRKLFLKRTRDTGQRIFFFTKHT